MGWGDSAEARRAASRGPTPPVPPPSPGPTARVARQKRRSGGANPLLIAAAAAAVLLPVAQHLGWLGALKRTLRRHGVRLPWSRGEEDDEDDEDSGGEGGGTRSAFRFPKGAPRSKSDAASSLPRTAQGKNKKGKSRKAGALPAMHTRCCNVAAAPPIARSAPRGERSGVAQGC